MITQVQFDSRSTSDLQMKQHPVLLSCNMENEWTKSIITNFKSVALLVFS